MQAAPTPPPAVAPPPSPRKNEVLLDTLRRLVRRGSKANIIKLLGKMRPEDVAVLMRGLIPAERHTVFNILHAHYPDAVGDVLTELDAPQRNELLGRQAPEKIASILENMEVDDAVYVVDSLPPELREPVLEVVDLKHLDEVQSHLEYEDDSAGRIMTTDYFALPAGATVEEAISALRGAEDVEMVFYLYVVDAEGRLSGVTSLRQLLLHAPDTPLLNITQPEVIHVAPGDDQEDVARLIARYDLLAVPVVGAEGELLGIVTVDDIVDIVKEEATEDFYKMAGTSEDELIYQERSLKVAGIRLPWLLINMVGLVLSGLLLETFQVNFKEALFLLTFVPVVMGMAGNSGTQVSTIAVRGLATGRLGKDGGRLRTFLWQQIKVGLILGIVTGLLVATIALGLERNLWYSVVVGASLFGAILIASFNGAVIPVMFEKFGVDPAVAAGPMVTTSNDILGLLIYFGLAALLIDLIIR
jgi:magnesium transporter